MIGGLQQKWKKPCFLLGIALNIYAGYGAVIRDLGKMP